MKPLAKYLFVQNDPFYLPRVLNQHLREYADRTAGINLQSVARGQRTALQTAMDLYRLYGFMDFQWKLRPYIWKQVRGKIINDWRGSTRVCHTVRAVARKYRVEVTDCPRVPMPLSRRFKCYVGLRSTKGKLETLLREYRFDTCSAVLGIGDSNGRGAHQPINGNVRTIQTSGSAP